MDDKKEQGKELLELTKRYNVSVAKVFNEYALAMAEIKEHDEAVEIVKRVLEQHKAKINQKEFDYKLAQAYNTAVYKNARATYEKTQKQQIEKGLLKYPEPLNPDVWTIGELVQHAFDELVDLSHYIQALAEKEVAANKTPQIELLYKDIEILRTENNELRDTIAELEQTLSYERKRVNEMTEWVANIKKLVIE